MKKNISINYLLMGVMASVGAFADMTVVKSAGEITVTSSISGTVIAKIIGPNDEVVVNEKYEGNSFSWTVAGVDGAYRYDVRVVPSQVDNEDESEVKSDYAGGSIEVKDGQMPVKLLEKEEE